MIIYSQEIKESDYTSVVRFHFFMHQYKMIKNMSKIVWMYFRTFKWCLSSLSNGTASIIEHLIDIHLINKRKEGKTKKVKE